MVGVKELEFPTVIAHSKLHGPQSCFRTRNRNVFAEAVFLKTKLQLLVGDQRFILILLCRIIGYGEQLDYCHS